MMSVPPVSRNGWVGALLAVLVVAALTGCASQIVQSRLARPTASDELPFPRNLDGFLPRGTKRYKPAGPGYDRGPGVEYFLPKRLFEFTLTRELDKGDDAATAHKKLVAAASALATAGGAAAVAGEKSKEAELRAKHTPASTDARKKADEARDSAAGELGLATETATAAAKNFEAALAAYRAVEPNDVRRLQALLASAHALQVAALEVARWMAVPDGDSGRVAGLAQATQNLTQAQQAFNHLYSAFEANPLAAPGPTATECNYKFTLAIKDLGLHPDFRYRFVASLNHNVFREDKLTLKTTPSGLLSNATGKSTDKTSDIVVAIAEAVALFGGAAPVGPGPGTAGSLSTLLLPAAPGVAPRCDTTKLARSFIVDPSEDEADHAAGNAGRLSAAKQLSSFVLQDLSPANTNVKLALRIAPTWNSEAVQERHADESCVAAPCDGLFYRRELPHVVSLEQCTAAATPGLGTAFFAGCGATDGAIQKVITTALLTMPNASPIARVELNAGPLVTTDHTVMFENGMLVSHEVMRPSELLELVSLPLTVARSMVTVLTDFIQLRINQTSNESGLGAAEIELLNTLDELKRTQQALRDGAALPVGDPPASQ